MSSTMASHSFLSDEATYSFYNEFLDESQFTAEEGEEEERKLSWRLDPMESHSDWTIVVQHQGTETRDTYHTHKNILAVGPCKSDYFASLFRSTHLAESQDNTSHIVLEEPAANAMPIMLDFIYDIPRHKLDICTSHVVALRYLSKYFGIRILYRKVMEFHKKDMTLDNISTYIQDAAVFHDESILKLAATKCLDNLQQLADERLLEQMDPSFFLRILSNPEVDTCSVSCQMSTLLVKYCQIHKDELTKELFEALTDRKYIPQIDREAAVALLELEVAICGVESKESGPSSSCLQKRCIKVLALHWKDFAQHDKMPSSTLQKLPSTVLVELMEKTILVAKQNHCDLERSKLTDSMSLEEHVEELKRKKAEMEVTHKLELQHCRQEGCEKANHLRSLLAEKDRQLLEYRREWDKMIRVPPNYKGFSDTRQSTFHHQAANEPFDSASNRMGRFGRIRPTAMPRIGESSEDGFLVLDTNGGIPHKRWPVFYYKASNHD